MALTPAQKRRHNEMARQHLANRRAAARATGYCVCCFKVPAEAGFRMCALCTRKESDRSRKRTARREQRRLAKGFCRCGATPPRGFIVCVTCRARNRKGRAALDARAYALFGVCYVRVMQLRETHGDTWMIERFGLATVPLDPNHWEP